MTLPPKNLPIIWIMWSSLLVFHSESKDRDRFHFEGMVHWKTCMRTVYIGDMRIHHDPDPSALEIYEVIKGYEAYKLLLEIISGLRSRLLGETEVLFQFREKMKNEVLPQTPFGDYLMRLRDQLIEDSRKIRSNYLRNLGDQSYGGMAHRYLKGHSAVEIIGTGQLSEKMIPWILEGGRKVTVYGRNPERLRELENKYSIKAEHLENYTPSQTPLVIAAPFSAGKFIPEFPDGSLILDFREDPLQESYPDRLNYKSFESMLQSLKENEERNKLLRQGLVSVLDEIVTEREMQCQNFIYGWEDLHCPA